MALLCPSLLLVGPPSLRLCVYLLTRAKSALAVHQLGIKIVALQWIFAFVVMSLLFVATLIIAIPGAFGKELQFREEGDIVSRDRERQPLLDDE